MHTDKNIQVFFELLRAGLWEKEVRLAHYNDVDLSAIMKMAEEQSVVGLITAGLEQVKDVKIPQEWTLQFIGGTLQIEQRNKAMNEFVAQLIAMLRKNDVYTILVKGQGIAQCYERPLWRSSGDVDLLLSDTNYEKAKALLLPIADSTEKEFVQYKHYGMTIKNWVVELHGTLRPRLSRRIDKGVDDVQHDIFYCGNVRSWQIGKTQVFLPGTNNDVIFLFTHILKHFYQGGIGLRQICDLCRFLWTYKEELDLKLLEERLNSMQIMPEWRAFGAYAVEYLGMSVEAWPFYSPGKMWVWKAKRISDFVMEVGNFGHNRDSNITGTESYFLYKLRAFGQRTKDSARHFLIFPRNSVRTWWRILITGLKER